ncbi:hypothetical protein CVH10_00285 [Halomonas sp. ND22Bw]|nr:hypothetical protein CVH10_00285 [Halomonas sp. ND22Bw]
MGGTLYVLLLVSFLFRVAYIPPQAASLMTCFKMIYSMGMNLVWHIILLQSFILLLGCWELLLIF